MKKLNPRETVILVICLSLAAVFIVWQFLIKPVGERGTDIDRDLRLSREHLIKAQEMVALRRQVEARYQNLVNVIGIDDPDGSQMPAMVSKIESAARETNVHIANMQPQKVSSEKEARFYPVELQIDGEWLDIVRFLYTLQQQPNYYFIDELNLEKYSDTVNSLRGRIVLSRMCLINP